MFTIQDMLIAILAMSATFAAMCAIADWLIPSAILLRRRRATERRIQAINARRLAPMMSEECR